MKNKSQVILLKTLPLLHLYRYATTLLLLGLCIFVFFWRLGESPIRQWDESQNAVNALEMSLNGNWIVRYLDGKPDLVNTKPNLAIWTIVISMELLGYNEFALRLPSAISATITVIILYVFGKNYLKEFKAGLIGGFILLTSIGFTGEHVARAGDHDAMLVLWITVYSLSYFMHLHSTESKKTFYLSITMVSLALAVWTKGIAGMLALPSLLIYTAYRRNIKKLLLSPQVYYLAIIFLALAPGYYFVREYHNPGYLEAVIDNELTGRYADVVSGGTTRGFFYYLFDMLSYRFVPWIYLLPVCLIITGLRKKIIVREFAVFSSIYLACYFLIISYSKTKFHWYDAPMYPIASLSIGLGLSSIIKLIVDYSYSNNLFNLGENKTLFKYQLSGVLLIMIFALPIAMNIYHEIYKAKVPYRENDKAISDLAIEYSEYFDQLADTYFDFEVNEIQVVNNFRYNLPLLFYTQVANEKSQYLLELQWETPSNNVFTKGEVIINCDPSTQKELAQYYEMKVLHSHGSCGTFIIEDRKN
jgi:4-amino-4-deoxy-L-arabinose transferase-like glycosyltransferase